MDGHSDYSLVETINLLNGAFMSKTTNSKDQNSGTQYAGGGTYTLNLQANREDIVTRVMFRGRSTGVITVNGWVVDGDDKEPLGTINLAEHRTMIIKDLALHRLELADAGSGAFHVIVTQGSV